jgi:hypothetical protein
MKENPRKSSAAQAHAAIVCKRPTSNLSVLCSVNKVFKHDFGVGTWARKQNRNQMVHDFSQKLLAILD